ncbi:hypothetical protein CF327_g6338 [Tilletia walkeri]|uniref:Uncharacterized protein n=1 Tax=Tilletia walkeri TaxID=117179 RepID=A0A8X7T1P6_9BASI|nr:hypothetical protein CF327_g6338 [Tilletia walkeri]KAE8265332.1 hypothetical protein A4X09_0g6682 [Tilletia walkeri]
MTATARFFGLAELVNLLCSYLSTEQVDLLALAGVSRKIRSLALPHFARHLDLKLSTADSKLNFFIAHPELLQSIRSLRIRNDISQRYYEYGYNRFIPDAHALSISHGPHWNEAKLLLAMIAAQSSSLVRPPAIDITVGITEITALDAALRPFPRLQQRIVALRILPDVDTNVEASAEQREYEEHWHHNWTQLARFIQRIQPPVRSLSQQSHDASGNLDIPGLRLFHFGHTDVEGELYDWEPGAVPLSFWELFAAATSSSLRDLSLFLARSDLPEDIFPLLSHNQLTHFVLKRSASGTIDALEDFLDQNQATLQDLHLDIGDPAEPLSFRQDFPQLQHCQVWSEEYVSRSTQLDRRIDFAKRHPQLKGTAHRSVTSDVPSFPRGIYPNLRVLSSIPDAFEEHALQGGRLSHLRTALYLPELVTHSWLAKIPEAASAITCLELHYRTDTLAGDLQPHFPSVFSSDFLPNLTELSIGYVNSGDTMILDWSVPSYGNPLSERELLALMASLCPAKKLRILHLSDSRAAPFENKGDLLAEFPQARFPPSFEYLTWFVPARNETQYYRFLPAEYPQREAADENRKGRLQRISSFFRTRITREGVWERAFDVGRRKVLMDHVPLEGPVMPLS